MIPLTGQFPRAGGFQAQDCTQWLLLRIKAAGHTYHCLSFLSPEVYMKMAIVRERSRRSSSSSRSNSARSIKPVAVVAVKK